MNINKSSAVMWAVVLSVFSFSLYFNGLIFKRSLSDNSPISYKDKIKIDNLKINQVISSPITITGQARGIWYFEASFPTKVYDGNGKEIAVGITQAQGEWTTENYVPFRVELKFDKPATPNGKIVFEKDNPSGLPEHADQFEVPVRFK